MNKKKFSRVYLYGNNGGDFVEIRNYDEDEGTMDLEVGHCCVKALNQKVPVEFLSYCVSEMLLEYGSVEEVIESTDWPVDFKTKLLAKVGEK